MRTIIIFLLLVSCQPEYYRADNTVEYHEIFDRIEQGKIIVNSDMVVTSEYEGIISVYIAKKGDTINIRK